MRLAGIVAFPGADESARPVRTERGVKLVLEVAKVTDDLLDLWVRVSPKSFESNADSAAWRAVVPSPEGRDGTELLAPCAAA